MVLCTKINNENLPPTPTKSSKKRPTSTLDLTQRTRHVRVLRSGPFRSKQASRPQQGPTVDFTFHQPQQKKTIALPRELRRPAFREVSREALVAASPELAEFECPPAELVRQMLPQMRTNMLRSLAGVRATPASDRLPDELSVIVNDAAAMYPPTHLMAVYGAHPKLGQPTQVKLHPAFGLAFAANCAKLPHLRSPLPITDDSSKQDLKVRVQPLCLPSPETYTPLANYLYTKNIAIIFSSLFLPETSAQTPAFFELAKSPIPYAKEIAQTQTSQTLLQYISRVFGLWQNVCSLGIFDDALWAAMDLVWKILLTALAIATGNPSLMINPS